MKKCKDCDLIGCLRRGDEETECFYDIDLQRCKEAEEKTYWQSFRAEAAKEFTAALLPVVDWEHTSDENIVKQAIDLANELIKQLKEKEEK